MAQDSLYLELLRQSEMNNSLVHDVIVKLTDDEMEIITKKANNIGIDIGEFLRMHLVKTPVFDGSVFQEKKSKVKAVKNEVESND
jgi:hypothetical protein